MNNEEGVKYNHNSNRYEKENDSSNKNIISKKPS